MGNFVLRFKVKHLMIMLLVLGVGALGLAHATQSLLFEQAQEARIAGDRERALALYDRFLDRCGSCPQGADALFWTAVDLGPRSGGQIIITSGGARGWVSNGSLPKDGVATAEERYRRLIDEHTESEWAPHALRNLIDLLMTERRWNEALYYVMWGLDQQFAESMQADLARRRIDIAYLSGDYARTIALGMEQINKQPEFGVFVAHLRVGDAHLQQGLLDEARHWYAQARQAGLQEPLRLRAHPEHNLESALALRAEWLAEMSLMQHDEGGSLTGRIEGPSDAVAGVEVLVGRKAVFGQRTPPKEGTYRVTTTDANGHFAFHGLASGEYTLAVRLRPGDVALSRAYYRGPHPLYVEAGESVEAGFRIAEVVRPRHAEGFVRQHGDRLHISWLPVDGAEYYVVQLGALYRAQSDWGWSSVSAQVARTEATEVELDIRELRWNVPMRSFRSDGSVANFSLLGLLYPGGENAVYVEAYDAHGVIGTNRVTQDGRWTGDSATFSIGSFGELSSAERLITEGRYAEAIAAFEKRLDTDPDDLTAALVLHRIYSNGTDSDRTHRDLARAYEIANHLRSLGVPEPWVLIW